jgi:hypothetical protein
MADSCAPKRRCWRPRQRPSLEEIFKNISRDGGLFAGMPTAANQGFDRLTLTFRYLLIFSSLQKKVIDILSTSSRQAGSMDFSLVVQVCFV